MDLLLLVSQFLKLAEDSAPDTIRDAKPPVMPSAMPEVGIGMQPNQDVHQFLKLLQVIATLKNKLNQHRDLDPYVSFYIGLLIQSKSGILLRAIRDLITRNVFSFDEYESIRNGLKEFNQENDMAGYLDMLLQTISNSEGKLSKEDKSSMANEIEFIIRELKKL